MMNRVQEQVRNLGLKVFPLNGKKPLKGYHWKERASCHPVNTPSYGIVCDEVAVIDADTREKAIEIFREKPKTPWMVKTPRGGVHFFFRGSLDLPIGQYDQWDLRAGGDGYVVGVGSIVKGKVYELVKGCRITLDLPDFDPAWIPSKSNGKAPQRRVRSVERYVMQIESIEGQGGSKGLVRAAAVCRDAEMSESEATILLLRWNQSERVRPAWSEKEIARAITRVYSREQ